MSTGVSTTSVGVAAFEPLEPRLLLSGLSWVEVGRCLDYEQPGPGDDAREYYVEAGAAELTDLELTTPWGEALRASDYLPPGWAGEPFQYFEDDLEFFAGSEEGYRWLLVSWDDLSASRWQVLDTGDTSMTVHYTGGSWTGQVDFDVVTQPTQVPTLTYPVHGEAGVPFSPTIEWEPWTAPAPDGWIELDLGVVPEGFDGELYEVDLPSDAVNWTVPLALDAGQAHEVEMEFVDHAVVPVGSGSRLRRRRLRRGRERHSLHHRRERHRAGRDRAGAGLPVSRCHGRLARLWRLLPRNRPDRRAGHHAVVRVRPGERRPPGGLEQPGVDRRPTRAPDRRGYRLGRHDGVLGGPAWTPARPSS